MVNYAELRELQRKLSKAVSLEDNFSEEFVCGVDCSFTGNVIHGVAAGTNNESWEIRVTHIRAAIPYIPGLLAFREFPAMASAILRLSKRPTLCFVNGHGIAHPREFGLASHVGVILDIPTIGVAKEPLAGKRRGKYLYLRDKAVGVFLSVGKREIVISPGHNVSLETAEKLAKKWLFGKSFPLPLFVADRVSKVFKELF